MTAPTQLVGFPSLPAELQIRVYKYVLAAVPREPSPGNLAPYAGLLLSCKKVASDFEYEWAKDYNSRLQHLVKDSNLRPLTVRKYCHAAHLRIIVPPIAQWPKRFHIPELMGMTSFCTIRLSYPTNSLTISVFLCSVPFYHLMALREDIAASGTIASHVDFGAQEIHCPPRRSTTATGRRDLLNALDGLPGEVWLRIAEEMLSEVTTTEEFFGVLNGLDQSCRSWRNLLYHLSPIDTVYRG